MKKIISPLLFLVLLSACRPNASNSTSSPSSAEEAFSTSQPSAPTAEEPVTHLVDSFEHPKVPEPGALQEVLGEAIGDLDKDGIAEKVLVYNTSRSTDLGTEREIHVFKKEQKDWTLWHVSQGAVLSSESGGVMGDPFRQVSIENGCIVLYQSGGSRSKWAYTHRFRFQEENWQLIGATVASGTPCLDWETHDYNLSTGKITYKKEKEHCKNGEKVSTNIVEQGSFLEQQEALPEMDGFAVGGNVAMEGKGKSFSY